MDWRANGANTHKPGMQLVVDIDDDGTPDGILVGERDLRGRQHPLPREPFGITNWWLSPGSANDAFEALAPSNTGGYGCGHCNGSLAEWRAALACGGRR